MRRAAAAFGLDVRSLRSLGGASGATWSDGEVVLRVGERIAAEVLAASAAAAGRACGAAARPARGSRRPGGAGVLRLDDGWGCAPPGPERNLLHLDLHPYNVLVDDAGEVTAVIDWTNAAAGDPRLDAARTWSILALDPAALALRAEPGWVALTEAWLDGLPEIPAPARAWACRFMLDDLAKRHEPAALQHVRGALRNLEL